MYFPYNKMFEILGIAIKHDTSLLTLHFLIQKGLSFNVFNKIIEYIGLPLPAISKIINISEQTIIKYKENEQVFTPAESQRIIRFINIIIHANNAFNDIEKTKTWLTDNAYDPIFLIETDIGLEIIIDFLNRIAKKTTNSTSTEPV